MQSTKSIPSTTFNLEDPKSWKALFNDKLSIDTPGMQADTIQEQIDWKMSHPREHYAEDVTKRIKLAGESCGCSGTSALVRSKWQTCFDSPESAILYMISVEQRRGMGGMSRGRRFCTYEHFCLLGENKYE